MPKSIHVNHHDTAHYIPIVRLIRNLSGTLSIAFIIQNVKITLHLEGFSRILCLPFRGVCVFTPEWAIFSLPNGIDSNLDIYPPYLEDPLIIRDAFFDIIPPSKTRKVKGVDLTLDPFQMVNSELKTNFKKWEIILSKNAISLMGNKDHPNACLCYMLYCLATRKYFNLAYYIVNKMVSVTKSANMTLPYGMLLTRLIEHIRVSRPHTFSDDLYIIDHVMIPLSERRVFRIMPGGKIHRLPTPTPTPLESSESTSSSHQEEEIDPPVPSAAKLVPLGTKEPALSVLQIAFAYFGGKCQEPTTLISHPVKHHLSKITSQSLNPINTTIDTTLALTIPSPTTIQIILTQETIISPLTPKALAFTTLPSSPLELHPYLTSLNDLPPRSSNPLSQTVSQGLSQTLPLPTLMDFESSFRPTNLSSARISAQPEPFLSRE
nr:hypothetical protein [Tanacetum cinerariifolium]